MDIAAHEAEFRREIVVHSDHLLPPRKRLNNGFDKERVGATFYCVGGYEGIKQYLGVCIDRNVVSGERVPRTRIDRAFRVTDRSYGGIGTDIIEIAAAFGVGRHLLVEAERIALAVPFLRPKEESLLLVGIVVVRDERRPANGVAEVMLFVSGFGVSSGIVKKV